MISARSSGYACRNPAFSVCEENKTLSTCAHKKNKMTGSPSRDPEFPICREYDNGSSYNNKSNQKKGLLSLPIPRKRSDFVNGEHKDLSQGEKHLTFSSMFEIDHNYQCNANQEPQNPMPLRVVRSTTRIELSDGTVYEVNNDHADIPPYEMHPNNHYMERHVSTSPTSPSIGSNSRRQYNQQLNVHPRPYHNRDMFGKHHQNNVDLSFYGPASHLHQNNHHYVESDVSTSPQMRNPRQPLIARNVERRVLQTSQSPKQRRSGSMSSLDYK